MRGVVAKKLRMLARAITEPTKRRFVKDTVRQYHGYDKDGELVQYDWGTIMLQGYRRVYKNMKKAVKGGYPLKQVEIDIERILQERKTANG